MGEMPVQKTDVPPDNHGARAFINRGRRLHAEIAQSALIVILKLIMSWSNQKYIDCFRYI